MDFTQRIQRFKGKTKISSTYRVFWIARDVDSVVLTRKALKYVYTNQEAELLLLSIEDLYLIL